MAFASGIFPSILKQRSMEAVAGYGKEGSDVGCPSQRDETDHHARQLAFYTIGV
jgi:hypothetical protein